MSSSAVPHHAAQRAQCMQWTCTTHVLNNPEGDVQVHPSLDYNSSAARSDFQITVQHLDRASNRTGWRVSEARVHLAFAKRGVTRHTQVRAACLK